MSKILCRCVESVCKVLYSIVFMNILVSTFGISWQIVPELFGFTNPNDYDFFCKNEEAKKLHDRYAIEAIDELWIITTEINESSDALDNLKNWAKNININLKQVECKGVKELTSNREIYLMRSCIYATVYEAAKKTKTGNLYLSLAGGRKTMSADMQDAGYLFGCKAMLHIIDVFPDKDTQDVFIADKTLSNYKKYSNFFLPIIINSGTSQNCILENIQINNNLISFKKNKCEFNDNGDFANRVQNMKDNSSYLFSNYTTSMDTTNERRIFYRLNFLHPNKIQKLKEKILGTNKEKDLALLKKLPKAELHSHLGGVLSASEIIEVALSEIEKRQFFDNKSFKSKIEKLVSNNNLPELKKEKEKLFELKEKCKETNFENFYNHLICFISAFKKRVDLFDELIFDKYIYPDNFYAIGLEEYQKLGDFQGSSLLQTKQTISKAVELYAKNLLQDNVLYVEIRCSPYKYTNLGLTAKEVLQIIIEVLDKICKDKLEYRFIMIVGRNTNEEQAKLSIEKIIELNKAFPDKIVGVDLAGTEKDNPPERLRNAFLPLLKDCLSVTIHAGETESVESIWEAVYHLNAERIGHGLKLNDKPKLRNSFLNKNIGVEMCPSSNDQIVGFSKNKPYPLKSYMSEGLKVTVNTDDCGISRTFLSNEFLKAAELSLFFNKEKNIYEGLSLWDCVVLIRNSLSIAFAPIKTKKDLMIKFENKIFELCQGEKLI